jgi:ATP-dependent helicase/nuclease subunit A
MNLHKAKGLEAPVVFLADPCGGFTPKVDVRIVRIGTTAEGYFQLCDKKESTYSHRVVAQPSGWDAHEHAEQVYLNAELNRLLYVAATRARDLLVVGRWAGTNRQNTRAWSAFDKWLANAEALKVPKQPAIPTEKLPDCSQCATKAAASARQAAFASAVAPSWSVTSVTAQAPHVSKIVQKAEGLDDDPSRTIAQDTPAHRADAGMAWGTLIHGLLEHAMRQQNVTTEDLRRLAMWLTIEQPELRSVLDRAVAVAQEVSRAPFWQEAKQSSEHHVETPFSAARARVILMGVIDLAFRVEAAWEIVDYKTDRRSDPTANQAYAQQLHKYADAWRAIAGACTRTSIRQVT